MENDIIIVSEQIEVHPGRTSGYDVVRNGSVYGTYEDLGYARELAEELAEQEGKVV